MKYFTFKELEHSQTAEACGITNVIPNETIKASLLKLVLYVLDPLREKIGKPIYVESGYRSKELNAAVGGVETSQHRKGEAADIRPYAQQLERGEYSKRLIEMARIIENEIDFDQLIVYRKRGFIHVSYKSVKENRHCIIYRG